MSNNFTNGPRSNAYVLAPAGQNTPSKYAAMGGTISSLTPKEKVVRRMAKMQKQASEYGFSSDPIGGASTVMSGATQFFSPQLSTDFLELPQSLRERREIYRHFYNSDCLVGQAIDLHTELPLSKVRLSQPKPTSCPPGFKNSDDYGKYILSFFERMCKKVKLFQRLILGVHHYWLDGTAAFWAEDGVVDVPQNIGYTKIQHKESYLTDAGEAEERESEEWVERDDKEDVELAYYQKHYKGWEKLIVLPIDQVSVQSFSFTDKLKIELIPSEKDRALIEQAKQGDPVAESMICEMPTEVLEHINEGRYIPLGTDPDEGSFVFMLKARHGADEALGNSILNRCHLAGTPVLAKRAEIIQQIPIEELDPSTDLVLSHTGVWSQFEWGTREVSEDVVYLYMSSEFPPIGCTRGHKYPVLRGGMLIEIEAQEICSGDFLQGVPTQTLNEGCCAVDFTASLVSWCSGSRHIEHEGKLYYRVSEVLFGRHDGPVYSLNVRDGHSFYAGFVRTCNCLRTLYMKEKLRQAQTQIASRNMTPKRIVWAEGLSETDTEGLREQVDLSLVDPDYSIVTNYEVHWEEMGSRDRLLDLGSEYEQLNKDLLAGLGVTESLMSGESLYSGDRLKLEVINTRYLLLREVLQEFVEDSLFAPVARRKGFVEKDAWGDDVVLFPKLSFTRLPLRDSQDTFDALYNLYNKGSLSIDIILEMFNLDPVDTQQKLEKDMFTVNDSTFNEMTRGAYGELGRAIVEKTDLTERLVKYMGLKIKEEPKEEESRF